jgi:hypothetical protein
VNRARFGLISGDEMRGMRDTHRLPSATPLRKPAPISSTGALPLIRAYSSFWEFMAALGQFFRRAEFSQARSPGVGTDFKDYI